MPGAILDIEQHLLLLELEAPFDKRDVQLARRKMAKRWHPDVAPAGAPVRARAPPEGDQRGGRPARAPGRGLARRARVGKRRTGQRRGRPPRARGGRTARLRGRAAGPGRRERQGQARPLREPRPRPLGGAPLRPLHHLSGVGRGHRHGHLLLLPPGPRVQRLQRGRRGRCRGLPAVGTGEIQPRRAHRSRREHEVRGLLQARPLGGARRTLPDRRPAGDGRGGVRARRPAPDLRARRRAAQHRRAAPDDARLLARRQARGGGPGGPGLGQGGLQTPRAATLRGQDLRRHGRV